MSVKTNQPTNCSFYEGKGVSDSQFNTFLHPALGQTVQNKNNKTKTKKQKTERKKREKARPRQL